MVLKEVVENGCVASCSAVCREWQAVMEKKKFSRLKLTPSRLANFGSISRRQRKLVRYIRLCIEIQDYDCSQCREEEAHSWYATNNDIIKSAIRDLFIVLSTW